MGETNLFLNVIERIRRVNGETDQDDVRVRVGQRSETTDSLATWSSRSAEIKRREWEIGGSRLNILVILLSGGIPQGQLDFLAVDLHVGNVVLEDGGDVDLSKISVIARWPFGSTGSTYLGEHALAEDDETGDEQIGPDQVRIMPLTDMSFRTHRHL